MPATTIQVGDADVLDVLGRLAHQVADLRPFFLEVGEEMVASTLARCDAETAPDGTPWQQLTARYLHSDRKQQSRGADRILTFSGDMRREIHVAEATAGHVVFGSGRVYAATYQFGRGPSQRAPFSVSPTPVAVRSKPRRSTASSARSAAELTRLRFTRSRWRVNL